MSIAKVQNPVDDELPGGSVPAGNDAAPLTPAARRESSSPARRRTITERLEAWVSRLSTRNNFWHKVCSCIWLPYAFRSGITMKQLGADRFAAVLPFRRFNRNWYNAMAGAALLGNSEVAAGMYLFAQCGSDYIVVCKELKYRFLRPCHGPAVYRIVNSDDVPKRIAAGGEFNVDLEMEIAQQAKENGRELRVGRCSITFHCTPKSMMKDREQRRRERGRTRLTEDESGGDGARPIAADEPDAPTPARDLSEV